MSDSLDTPVWVLILQTVALIGCLIPYVVRRMPHWLRGELLQLACVSKLGILTLLTGAMNHGCSVTCGMLGTLATLGMILHWPGSPE